MNKSGKGSFLALILIPVFLIVTIVISDTVINYIQNKRFKEVTESILTEVMNNNKLSYDDFYSEIKRLYEYKGYSTERLIVFADRYKVSVDNEHSYFGLISSITNPKSEKDVVNILGIDFNVKKGSKIIISVEAKYNRDNEIEFEYVS